MVHESLIVMPMSPSVVPYEELVDQEEQSLGPCLWSYVVSCLELGICLPCGFVTSERDRSFPMCLSSHRSSLQGTAPCYIATSLNRITLATCGTVHCTYLHYIPLRPQLLTSGQSLNPKP